MLEAIIYTESGFLKNDDFESRDLRKYNLASRIFSGLFWIYFLGGFSYGFPIGQLAPAFPASFPVLK